MWAVRPVTDCLNCLNEILFACTINSLTRDYFLMQRLTRLQKLIARYLYLLSYNRRRRQQLFLLRLLQEERSYRERYRNFGDLAYQPCYFNDDFSAVAFFGCTRLPGYIHFPKM